MSRNPSSSPATSGLVSRFVSVSSTWTSRLLESTRTWIGLGASPASVRWYNPRAWSRSAAHTNDRASRPTSSAALTPANRTSWRDASRIRPSRSSRARASIDSSNTAKNRACEPVSSATRASRSVVRSLFSACDAIWRAKATTASAIVAQPWVPMSRPLWASSYPVTATAARYGPYITRYCEPSPLSRRRRRGVAPVGDARVAAKAMHVNPAIQLKSGIQLSRYESRASS